MTKASHQVPGALPAPLVGPPLLTGGSLGPQGSIVALVVVLAVSIYLLARRAARTDRASLLAAHAPGATSDRITTRPGELPGTNGKPPDDTGSRTCYA